MNALFPFVKVVYSLTAYVQNADCIDVRNNAIKLRIHAYTIQCPHCVPQSGI